MKRTLLIAAAVAALVAGTASAQSVDHVTDYGFQGFEGNELTVGSRVDDPPKVRVTSPITEHGGGGGVFSANASAAGETALGGRQREMGMVRIEQAEDVRGQVSNLKAEFNVLLNDGLGADDANMQKPLAFTYYGITRLSPWLVADLRSIIGGGSSFSRIVSPNGRYWFQPAQEDGNFVLYRVDTDDNGDPRAVPIFDLWSLMARLDRVDAELNYLRTH